MSKPNTLHIIGFNVKQWTVTAPAVVDIESYDGVYELGVFEAEVFE